jgi:dual specificity tyrosine-phosphorylation-regulated kinase 2/3/4
VDKSKNYITPRKFKFHVDEHIAYRFQMRRLLAKGSFGGVLHCIDHKCKRPVAIKLLRDGPKHHDHISMESEFLELLQTDGGPASHIVRLYDTVTFRGYVCFALELHSANLFQVMRSRNFSGLALPDVKVIAREGAEALRFCHAKGVVHGDVKPENIVFTNARQNSITLIDFGSSAHLAQTVFTYIQSRFYRATEIVLGLRYDGKIDIWSLGCVLSELVTGRPLFEAEDEQELIQKFVRLLGCPPMWMVQRGRRSHHYFRSKEVVQESHLGEEIGITDQGFLGFIGGCLTWDPAVRLSAEEILEHPWIRKRSRPATKNSMH